MPTAHTNARWYALEVCPEMEHRAARHLQRRGYECFVPNQPADADGRGTAAPPFEGYVFCRLSTPAEPLHETPGVIGIVSFGGIPAVVDEHEIVALQQQSPIA